MPWTLASEEENKLIKSILAKEPSRRSTLDLQLLANRIRRNVIEAVYLAASGHPGGPLGLADIYAVLYFKVLNFDVKNPLSDERDRHLLSNGHVCAVKYASMALAGFFPEEELATFRKLGSRLQGHPSTRYFPELENSSGSLGQGLSQATGLALGLRLRKKSNHVFVGLSDGECQEGMTWEAAMAAAHYQCDQLIAYVDWNNIQIDGYVNQVMDLGALDEKFRAFGWKVQVANGHDIEAIERAFLWARQEKGSPKVILFRTTLGKGVSFMENNPEWHGSPPKKEQRDKALAELYESFHQLWENYKGARHEISDGA
ncbi:MAG: transketolase [Leptospiraceae bacterium]|nr:transketolase [Leptospiraceae bacterium]MDW8306630.1 transketolase [Leptospiraceae bacterium]